MRQDKQVADAPGQTWEEASASVFKAPASARSSLELLCVDGENEMISAILQPGYPAKRWHSVAFQRSRTVAAEHGQL